jgi:glycosyltransferase involved in cell wall biosynthesis
MSEFPISVILPFYKGDEPLHLNEALESLYNQTARAEEIVLIQDGPVPKSLQRVVTDWMMKMPEINLVALQKNSGLSSALNAGIDIAQHEWLARMDADDICQPQRFERQKEWITKDTSLSILGSWIDEYDEEMKVKTGVRRLPQNHGDIVKYARWRCPFNHMTVMYRKSVLEKKAFPALAITKLSGMFAVLYPFTMKRAHSS